MSQIRTRFAPSPTGFLHVGGIRTALFAWLVARQADGEFVLRIEDTDQKREVEGSTQHIIDSLAALGLDYDEGPNKPGDFGPYYQSQRLEVYRKWAQKLIDSGRAYADPYSPQELQAFREQAQKEKRAFLYRHHRPENPATWDGTAPLRFKSDPKNYQWHDEVMGELTTGPEVIDDVILIKSDGFPTYNFAHIVDDAEMKINHVIRGQEFISSQPNYLNVYDALEIEPPIFATMPHIMAEQGGKKLSKRDGATDVLEYIRDGYLPETLVSFIATLGWNDGSLQEIFSKRELIEKFSLSRVQKSGARFDEKRLLWMNGQFIRQLELEDLYERSSRRSAEAIEVTKSEVQPEQPAARREAVTSGALAEKTTTSFWPASAQQADDSYKKQVLDLMQDRLKTLADLKQTDYFFVEPTPNMDLIESNKQLKKLNPERRQELLSAARKSLEKSEFTPEKIQESLNQLLEETGEKPGILFSLIRIYLTWTSFSPQLNETIALLGKETLLRRLQV